jgi:peptidyl-prolyl cis-trans isomerase SurA
MSGRQYMTARCRWAGVVLAGALSCGSMQAQVAAPQPTAQPAPQSIEQPIEQPTGQPTGPSANTPAQDAGAVPIDRVVAIVNGDLVLESDVDEERRFAVFQPYSLPVGSFSRSQAIERLIDRTLILQQSRVQPEKPLTDAQVTANLADVRKDILACKEYKCETEAGWQAFLKANGFTEVELTRLWRLRMETLAFIERRFRAGISISDADAREYYTKTLLPQYAERKSPAPKFDAISDRIREILLQEQVSKLLDDWLKELKASGNVKMVKAGEVGL